MGNTCDNCNNADKKEDLQVMVFSNKTQEEIIENKKNIYQNKETTGKQKAFILYSIPIICFNNN